MDATNDQHATQVLRGLNELRESSQLTDVVLEVEGRSFPCHRAVLASCSPYFRSMFTSGYAEVKQERITIQDVSEVAMATILDYAYTGCLKTEPDQVQAVMSAARLLQVDFVCRKAAEYMKDLLDMPNCVDVFMYADMLGDPELQEASRRYMASRFNPVSQQPSFLKLSLPQLQSLMDRDDLIIKSENNVVQAALRWIDFNKEERLQHLPALCRSFRHSFLSPEDRLELENKCLSTDSKLVYSESTNQRLGQERVELQIFIREDESQSAPCYDPSKETTYKMNMPDNLQAFSVAVSTDDELYLAGGVNSASERQKTFFQYNHLLNSWETRCEMISPRVRCGLAYCHGYIYAIGGDNTRETAERYDPRSDEWTSIAPIPFTMSSELCAVGLEDSIYVISKEGCYCYSTSQNSWSKMADMLEPPQCPQAVVWSGNIFCIDCDKDWQDRTLTSVEMYNPKVGEWKRTGDKFGDKLFSFHNGTLITYGRSLYLFFRSIALFDATELYQYHEETDRWLIPENTFEMLPLHTPLYGFRTSCRTDCLVARMIPSCLGDAGEYTELQEGSDDEEETDDTFSESSGSGDSSDSDSENSLSDEENSEVDEDRESESDDGSI